MIKKLKTMLTTLTISGMIFLPLGILTPVVAHADANSTPGLCKGANLTFSSSGSSTTCPSTADSIDKILSWVLDIFSVVVGIAAVIMIVVGGLKYTISGGDSTRVSGAKDTILFAIVGLVVVALAQIIVHFVLSNVQQRVGS